jgi:IS5 family transposase
MPKQPAFPGLRDAMKKKQTRRGLFLAGMEAVVPLGSSSGAERAALPQGGAEGRASADAA